MEQKLFKDNCNNKISIRFSWHDVTVKSIRQSISDTDKPKKLSKEQTSILDNVFGIAYSGEVMAIMGSSGAGKTSLLNFLTQQNLSSVKAFGVIRINGFKIDKSTLRSNSAYVQQNDLFIGSMTVIEHLRFMAILRMGKRYTKDEREKRIQSLGLTQIANSIIGWPYRLQGISGGERKRLAFASEIMTGSPVLFCDEPTSGLDAFLAQQVVQVLKNLAKQKNMVVIITIHQPSSQIFELFDKICLIANGRIAFLGKTKKALELWNSVGYPLPKNFNPSDHFISTLAVDLSYNSQSKYKINKICDAFIKSDIGRKTLFLSQGNFILNSNKEFINSNNSKSLNEATIWCENDGFCHKNFCKASWIQQLISLTKRSFFVTVREPILLKVRLIQTIFIGLLLGVIYFNTQIRQTTVININGLLFQAIANMNFLFQFAAVNVFCDELPIFMRENLAHLYRVDTYFIAKNIADLPQYFLYPIVFSSILYWMTGFVKNSIAYVLFTLSCLLITNVAVSLAYAVACIFGTTTISTTVLPVIVIPLLAFGGFYINQESLPFYFYPVKYLSYFGYAFESVTINEWKRIQSIPGCKNTTYINSFDTMNSNLSIDYKNQCFKNGFDVIKSLNFKSSNLLFDYLALLIMSLSLRIIAFIALLFRTLFKKL